MEKRKFNLQLFAEGTEVPEAKEEHKKSDEPTVKEPEDEKKYSDKDVDEILNKKFARWQEKQQKAVDEAKKLAEMNAQQKAEYERDELQKQLDEYKRKDSIAEMTKTARKMLSEEGVGISDDLLAMMVNTDAEQTKAAIDGFVKAFKDAVESAVKERLRGETPRKGTGTTTTMTKEQIMEIKDPELRQKKMLEHRELFNF